MKLTLKKKLTLSLIATILMVVFIVLGVQVIMKLYKSTTEKLLLEYHESQALQKLSLSLGKLQTLAAQADSINQTLQYSILVELVNDAKNSMHQSKSTISNVHNKSHLDQIDSVILRIGNHINSINPENTKNILFNPHYIRPTIDSGIHLLGILDSEIKEEIEEYEKKSQVAIIHGTSTVLLLGLFLIIVLIVIGHIFIKSITKPIDVLLSTTKQIATGDHNSRVKLNSEDEFQSLAISFNGMLDVLERTTISKQYLNNIIDNMFDILIVTDSNYSIKIVNKTAYQILRYSPGDLLGVDVHSLFKESGKNNSLNQPIVDLYTYATVLNEQKYILTKDNEIIPAIISCTQLFNDSSKLSQGLIIVGHDLTETKKYEKKIEETRKERLIAINEAQEQEKMRIATDLHDGLGQMLTAISYTIQNLNNTNNIASEEVQQVRKLIDNAIQETKNIAHNLMPMVLKDFGLVVAIQNLVDKANLLNSTTFHFSSYDFVERLDPKLEKALFRICQEAMSNIQKHANAKKAYFQLYRTKDLVTFVIDDDGVGFDPSSVDKLGVKIGLGLMSMKERVASFNGILTINSAKNQGAEIMIEIPCIKK